MCTLYKYLHREGDTEPCLMVAQQEHSRRHRYRQLSLLSARVSRLIHLVSQLPVLHHSLSLLIVRALAAHQPPLGAFDALHATKSHATPT